MDGHHGPRSFQRHHVVPVGHLAADCGSHGIGSIVPIQSGIPRVDHPQFARLAQIDRRKASPHAFQQQREAEARPETRHSSATPITGKTTFKSATQRL